MSIRPALPRRLSRVALPLLSCAALAAGLLATPVVAQPAATKEAPPEAPPEAPADEPAGPLVPPVPDGTPEELLKFAEGLRQPKNPPRSRPEMMRYMQEAMAASVQVADKVLGQVQPADESYAKAARLKLESLGMLGAMGDPQAEKDAVAFAKDLAASPNAALAKEAAVMLLATEAKEVFTSGSVDGAGAIIQKLADKLAADANDPQMAGLAMQFAGALERMPGGEPAAVKAYEAFAPLFEKSDSPQIKRMGEGFAGTLRRLSLPGKPMEIKGTLLDGTKFDPATLAGKVVLVDFWATWCGPCRAEIPNMKKEYEKYREKGFEVVGVSVDDDRGALESFVKDEEIPWPILVDNGEGGAELARYYGIRGIPQLILIGRDGNVITLNARGPKLAEELEKLFKDAG